MICRRVLREEGGIRLELGDFNESPDHDLIATDDVRRNGDDLLIRLYHRRRNKAHGLQIIQVKEGQICHANQPVTRWRDLPPEIWGHDQEELWPILLALSEELMSPYQKWISEAVIKIADTITA